MEGPAVSLLVMALLPFCAALLGTALVRHVALRLGVLDAPNARSSHSGHVPRGGGLAFVVTIVAAAAVLASQGKLDIALFQAVAFGGMAVAGIGILDDRRGVPAGVRLAVHFIAAGWALTLFLPLPVVTLGPADVVPGPLGSAVAIVAGVWLLNLYNFMDGIDGIAAAEAIFLSLAGVALIGTDPSREGELLLLVAVASACTGFLAWNWAPARVFMGDVGSGFLGYLVGVIALASIVQSPGTLWSWIILTSLFVADATTTLLRRLMRGELVVEAHRTHAYQWLARRWSRHSRVVLLYMSLNVFLLLPLALWVRDRPRTGPFVAAGVLLGCAALALLAGAGRAGRAADRTDARRFMTATGVIFLSVNRPAATRARPSAPALRAGYWRKFP